MENDTIKILLERQKKQILAYFRAERFPNTSSKPEIDHTLACDDQLRRDRQLLHEQLSEQNRDLREVHMKSLNEM